MKDEVYAHKYLHLNYDVVFECWDGGIERYGYIRQDEALYHFGVFDETDGDIYKRIYVEDLNTGEILKEKEYAA